MLLHSQLNQNNSSQVGLISDVEEEVQSQTREVSTKTSRKNKTKKSKNENVIDLDM